MPTRCMVARVDRAKILKQVQVKLRNLPDGPVKDGTSP
jgi:hypothetical protein